MSMQLRTLKAHNYSRLCKVRRKFRFIKAVALVSILALIGVTAKLVVLQAKPQINYYVAYGTAWANGNTIWTEDGNIWNLEFPMETVEGKEVRCVFCDNGTPENIYDDIIVDVVSN